jgi:hypothetical protein
VWCWDWSGVILLRSVRQHVDTEEGEAMVPAVRREFSSIFNLFSSIPYSHLYRTRPRLRLNNSDHLLLNPIARHWRYNLHRSRAVQHRITLRPSHALLLRPKRHTDVPRSVWDLSFCIRRNTVVYLRRSFPYFDLFSLCTSRSYLPLRLRRACRFDRYIGR